MFASGGSDKFSIVFSQIMEGVQVCSPGQNLYH